ncbi:MAG: hypothetical protein II755_06295, partial [Prevotella sp.]|nr:hypothetical protein [Prevotella sp.]
KASRHSNWGCEHCSHPQLLYASEDKLEMARLTPRTRWHKVAQGDTRWHTVANGPGPGSSKAFGIAKQFHTENR